VPPAYFIPNDGQPNSRALSEFVIDGAINDWRYFVSQNGPIELAINRPITFLQYPEAINRSRRTAAKSLISPTDTEHLPSWRASRRGRTLSRCTREGLRSGAGIPVRKIDVGAEARADHAGRPLTAPRWKPAVSIGSIDGRNVMNAVLVLLAMSALVGFMLGLYFPWGAILVSGLILALLAAAVLQNEGFGFFAGIAIIVACLSVNQIAYLIGTALVARGRDNQ
jgi:hypothetical protein